MHKIFDQAPHERSRLMLLKWRLLQRWRQNCLRSLLVSRLSLLLGGCLRGFARRLGCHQLGLILGQRALNAPPHLLLIFGDLGIVLQVNAFEHAA